METPSDPSELIADFLNSVDVRSFGAHARRPAVDQIATPEALRRWLIDRGRCKRTEAVSPADHRAAIQLRDGLRKLVQTETSGPGAGAVNAVSRRLPLMVSFHDGKPRVEGGGSTVSAYLTEILAACLLAEAQGGWPLIKLCAADDCHWAFVDRSRNRMGRWCDTRVCGNRVKTRRYRERQRSTTKEAGSSGAIPRTDTRVGAQDPART